jgi:hypothetical protein
MDGYKSILIPIFRSIISDISDKSVQKYVNIIHHRKLIDGPKRLKKMKILNVPVVSVGHFRITVSYITQ